MFGPDFHSRTGRSAWSGAPLLGAAWLAALVLGTLAVPRAEAMPPRRGKHRPARREAKGPMVRVEAKDPKIRTEAKAPESAPRFEDRAVALRPVHHQVRPDQLQPGANLRCARLDPGWNLAGRDLRRADLSYANLRKVNFTGARMDQARLFGADIRGALGLDLSKLEVHPFYELREGEGVGAVTYLELGDSSPAPWLPCQMVSAGDRGLLWLAHGGKALEWLFPSGCIVTSPCPEPLRAFYGLALDRQERMFLLSEKCISVFPAERLLSSGADLVEVGCFQQGIGSRPLAAQFDALGGLWVSTQVGLERFESGLPRTQKIGVYRKAKAQLPSAAAGDRMLPYSRALQWSALVAPTRDSLLVAEVTLNLEHLIPLPPGGKAQALAEAADGDLWCTLPGIGALARIDAGAAPDDPSSWKARRVNLDDPKGAGRTPHALARGEDGNLWFTDPRAGCIGRITPEGEIRDFPLGPGIRPVEIIASGDGRMFFTLANRALIGSIRTVAVPAEPEAAEAQAEAKVAAGEAKAAPAGFEVQLPARQPQRRNPLSRRERWERALQAEFAAWDVRATAAAEGPEAAPLPSWSEVARRQPLFEAKAEPSPLAAGADQPPVQARLAALGVTLQPGMAEFILGKHGWRADPSKSQFAEVYSTPAAFQAMLADTLAGVAIGQRIGRDGRFLTHFDLKSAGRVGGSEGPETDRVLLVTSEYWDSRARRWMHDVVNAFPVPAR